jgi:putative transposase
MNMHGRPLRLRDWDYSRSGGYFVTFVVAGRKPLLRHPDGRLTAAGRTVLGVWDRLSGLNPRVEGDQVAIQPDHVHAIIYLVDHPTDRASLGTVVRRWKAASTSLIRRQSKAFGWQSHYHDWIIRDQQALLSFRSYILKNRLHGG